MPLEPDVAQDDYCYLTTTGRKTGRPHSVEIWFAIEGATLYLLAGNGERSDWVQNLRRDPAVRVRLRERIYGARARSVEQGAEDELARSLLVAKYQPRYRGDLADWRVRSLPVAIELAQQIDEQAPAVEQGDVPASEDRVSG